MEPKSAMRRHFRELLRAYSIQHSSDTSAQASAAVVRHLVEFLSHQTGCWAGFSPRHDEPQISSLFDQTPHLRWVMPRVNGENIEFFECPKSDEDWVKHTWGMAEPNPETCAKISQETIDGYLVPGLAFDDKGGRLGRGKGFYDRCLRGHSGYRVGVCYAEQISTVDLPLEGHDCVVDCIISENGPIEIAEPLRVNRGQ